MVTSVLIYQDTKLHLATAFFVLQMTCNIVAEDCKVAKFKHSLLYSLHSYDFLNFHCPQRADQWLLQCVLTYVLKPRFTPERWSYIFEMLLCGAGKHTAHKSALQKQFKPSRRQLWVRSKEGRGAGGKSTNLYNPNQSNQHEPLIEIR